MVALRSGTPRPTGLQGPPRRQLVQPESPARSLPHALRQRIGSSRLFSRQDFADTPPEQVPAKNNAASQLRPRTAHRLTKTRLIAALCLSAFICGKTPLSSLCVLCARRGLAIRVSACGTSIGAADPPRCPAASCDRPRTSGSCPRRNAPGCRPQTRGCVSPRGLGTTGRG